MAYPSKPKGEDPNGQSANVAPPSLAPLPSTSGGAPVLNMDIPRWMADKKTAPAEVSVVPATRWSLQQVRDQNPSHVQSLSKTMYERMNSLSAEERAHPFWQQVKQNPDAQAAMVLRRMMQNADVFRSENAPKLEDAARAGLENSRLYRLMETIKEL